MMNMVYGDKEEEQYFITDLECKDDKIVVTHANGSKEETKLTAHNLSFYRNRMIEQAEKSLPEFSRVLSKESFKVCAKKFGAIIGGLVGLFLLYNLDIHIIMKIIITILVLLGEAFYYLFSEILLGVMSPDCVETLATEYYLANLNDFRYYDQEQGVDGYILPPEDIGKYKLDDNLLKQMSEVIKDFKSQGFEDKEISLTYKKHQPKKTPETN